MPETMAEEEELVDYEEEEEQAPQDGAAGKVGRSGNESNVNEWKWTKMSSTVIWKKFPSSGTRLRISNSPVQEH